MRSAIQCRDVSTSYLYVIVLYADIDSIEGLVDSNSTSICDVCAVVRPIVQQKLCNLSNYILDSREVLGVMLPCSPKDEATLQPITFFCSNATAEFSK